MKKITLIPEDQLPTLETMGERIRWARERRGVSQERLGQILSVDQTTVGKWELNKAVPRNPVKLGEELEVSAAWLMYGHASLEKLSDEAIKLALDFDSKTEEQKELIKGVVRQIK